MARMAPSRQGDMDGPQDKLGASIKKSNIKEKSTRIRNSSLGAGQPFRADYSSIYIYIYNCVPEARIFVQPGPVTSDPLPPGPPKSTIFDGVSC